MTTPQPQDPCPNRTPLPTPARYGTCPECGAFLAVLTSGAFRKHARRFQPGDPRIAQAVARAEGKP